MMVVVVMVMVEDCVEINEKHLENYTVFFFCFFFFLMLLAIIRAAPCHFRDCITMYLLLLLPLLEFHEMIIISTTFIWCCVLFC